MILVDQSFGADNVGIDVALYGGQLVIAETPLGKAANECRLVPTYVTPGHAQCSECNLPRSTDSSHLLAMPSTVLKGGMIECYVSLRRR